MGTVSRHNSHFHIGMSFIVEDFMQLCYNTHSSKKKLDSLTKLVKTLVLYEI